MSTEQNQFTEYDLKELRKALREIIPRCSPIPILNKNSTPQEIIDVINFLEQQGKYNQKMEKT